LSRFIIIACSSVTADEGEVCCVEKADSDESIATDADMSLVSSVNSSVDIDMLPDVHLADGIADEGCYTIVVIIVTTVIIIHASFHFHNFHFFCIFLTLGSI